MSHRCDECGGIVQDEPKMRKFALTIDVELFAVDEASAIMWGTGVIPLQGKVLGVKARPFTPSLLAQEPKP